MQNLSDEQIALLLEAGKLARRTLFLAHVWNDHNFDAAHIVAAKTAGELGIYDLDDANGWLESFDKLMSELQRFGE